MFYIISKNNNGQLEVFQNKSFASHAEAVEKIEELQDLLVDPFICNRSDSFQHVKIEPIHPNQRSCHDVLLCFKSARSQPIPCVELGVYFEDRNKSGGRYSLSEEGVIHQKYAPFFLSETVENGKINYSLAMGENLICEQTLNSVIEIPEDSMFTAIELDDDENAKLDKVDPKVFGKPVLLKFSNGFLISGFFEFDKELGAYYGLWDGDVLAIQPVAYVLLSKLGL